MSTYANNSKALFDYEILERYSAGIELLGTEVKSVREGKMNLRGAFIAVRGNEAYLIGAKIPAYQPKNAPQNYDALRARKILLSKNEIAGLKDAEGTKGLTIIPIKVYSSKSGKLKLQIALAKGKKQYNKKEAKKEQDIKRDVDRLMRGKEE
jgi:SsrA-binding protein